jgi:hypothetical protein
MDEKTRPLSFSRFIPPNTFGPLVTVARADIVAVSVAYDTRSNQSRALLHLRGGSELLVSESFRDAEVQVYGCSGRALP